jgi:hypothetical protein
MIHSRLADWVLTCATPSEDREAVVGDLAEEYAIRLSEGSPARALWWYWNQVIRAVPWLLWIPLRRSGVFGALAVAIVACIVQAGVELCAVFVIRNVAVQVNSIGPQVGLSVVLLSLFMVSYAAARVRPGAGTLVAVIAMVAAVSQSIAIGPAALGLSHVAGAIAAPSAALAGAAFSTARTT